MTYENFLKVILQLQKQDQVINNLYKNNVDLLEFVDPYHQMISTLIEEIYGKLDDFSEAGSIIGEYLNCKQFGYKSLRGAVKGGASPGSPVTIDCKFVPEKVEDFNTINYSPADFISGYQAIDPSSSYRKQDLIPKIEELNDIIDKNLISVIEGEQ